MDVGSNGGDKGVRVIVDTPTHTKTKKTKLQKTNNKTIKNETVLPHNQDIWNNFRSLKWKESVKHMLKQCGFSH